MEKLDLNPEFNKYLTDSNPKIQQRRWRRPLQILTWSPPEMRSGLAIAPLFYDYTRFNVGALSA
jgi:hypothetical protein